jgi:uncharacterized protein YciI
MLPVMKSLILATVLLAACSASVPAQQPVAPSTSPQPTAPAKKAWFIRLIAPRPTFVQDMTEAEKNLMEQHFLYWKGMFEKGVCVFGGPVLDPKGVYGVLAIMATSEDEARTIAADDPSVKGGVNRIEVAEMRIAFLQPVHQQP